MNAKDIIEQKFEKAFNGYKPDEVDEFLRSISEEFSKLQKDNYDLEKKLEVLADKIREYREDEEALKDALLGAQKQANAILAGAREKSENMLKDAQKEVADLRSAADAEVLSKKEEASKLLTEAKAEGAQTVSAAKAEADKLRNDMKADGLRIISEAKRAADEAKSKNSVEIMKLEETIARTKRESDDYRSKLISVYRKHIEMIEAIPRECENEFVKKINEKGTEAVKKAEAPQPIKPQPAQPVQPAQPTQPTQPTQPAQPTQPVQPTQPAQPAKPVQPTPAVPPVNQQPKPEKAEGVAFEVKLEADDKNAAADKKDGENPFFVHENHDKPKEDKEPLQFGSNNK